MKAFFSAILCYLALTGLAQAAPISYGDISGGGVFQGQTTSNSAWALENPTSGDEVNFWTFTGQMGAQFSVVIDSVLNGFDTAVSLYLGQVDTLDLLMGQFNNSGDFGAVSYITGSSPFGTGGLSASLFEIVLPATGLYTLAVGGESFLSFADQYGYTMNVAYSVPEPSTLALMVISLLGVTVLRRRAA